MVDLRRLKIQHLFLNPPPEFDLAGGFFILGENQMSE
jgi:hypothetical protein